MSAWVEPAFAPGFKLGLFTIGLVAGCCAEIGWTGLATPRRLARRQALAVGLQRGVLWAVWHAAADFSSDHAATGSNGWAWSAVCFSAAIDHARLIVVRA